MSGSTYRERCPTPSSSPASWSAPGDLLQDNHRTAVHTEVWDLLRHVLPRAPISGFMIERDSKLPDDFPEILADIARTREVLGTSATPAGQR